MTKKRKAEAQRKLGDLRGFLLEFRKENDRGCALLGAALLDEHLRQLLTAFMVDEPKNLDSLLDEPGSPLGSFYARTLTAYCLGLISPNTKSDLEIIRRVRNDFAHGLHEISFSNNSMSDRCRSLTYPNMWNLGPGIAGSARLQYILSVAINRQHIDMVTREIKEGRRQRRQVMKDLKGYVWDKELISLLKDSLGNDGFLA